MFGLLLIDLWREIKWQILYIALRVACFSYNVLQYLYSTQRRQVQVYIYIPSSAPASTVWEFINLIESRSGFSPQPIIEIQTGREPTWYLLKQPLNHILVSGSKPCSWTAASIKPVCFSEVVKLILWPPGRLWMGGAWTASAAMLSRHTCQGASPPAVGMTGVNSQACWSLTWIGPKQSTRRSLSWSLDFNRQFL